MEYNFRDIEKKWQRLWQEKNAYKVFNGGSRPAFYVLDMFPYPSGAGLHVGHPLGYIASDIYSRYKRLKGFNVLHPMGYDSFGLPAEQYAIETGQHPAVTTEKNIATFRAQLDKIGFSYDWSREVRTSDPSYYKWTQWIFLQLFDSWFDRPAGKARRIPELISIFEAEGNIKMPQGQQGARSFSADGWKALDETEKQEILMSYRLAYSSFGEVNWCEALGTVLANDEVVNGVSERGGYPVVKKKMRQWYLRITEYADRLLQGLEQIEFTESLKEQQRNWIGKSQGAEITFSIKKWKDDPFSSIDPGEDLTLKVYTTRPDTIFGVDFMVLAPEHELVPKITRPGQQQSVGEYLEYVKSRSERERMAEVKQITGCFTGAYAINPFDGREIPVWISEYVLAGYGTGAIMAVPCGDQRDHNFATHFDIPVTNIIGEHYNGAEANPTKDAILQNSGFLDGMVMHEAMEVVIRRLEEMHIGRRQINYRMRDAGFSRQRYWGEPFPIVWRNGIAYPLTADDLPLELPHVERYGPGPEGEGPLANLRDWTDLPDGGRRETSTMPGYAGSSWYFLRYMDPHNGNEFCSREASGYWQQVDMYIGGTEHAVGHLLYSRLWTKVLYDLGFISFDEPFKKLVNQGMIQGSSRFVYRLDIKAGPGMPDETAEKSAPVFISYALYREFAAITGVEEQRAFLKKYLGEKIISGLDGKNSELSSSPIHVDVNLVDGTTLDIPAFRNSRPEWREAVFILDNGRVALPAEPLQDGDSYTCGAEVEKMSKSKYNTVNPDQIVDQYGADTFRIYEMFLGPIEQSKPWDTKGIEGVHRFLRKLWRLFYDDVKGRVWDEEAASQAELKVLHRAIRKIGDDTERLSYNTAVSAFMVCVNELAELRCHKKEILEKLLILLSPYAPHICEELWQLLGNEGLVIDATYPTYEEIYLIETVKEYPVSVNGKLRASITMALDATQEEVEQMVLSHDTVKKWLGEKPHKKIVFVKGKMVNIVV